MRRTQRRRGGDGGGGGFFVGRRQSGQARHGQAGEGMAWGTVLMGQGVMNGASEIFFLFNWRCQKPFIHCTAKLQMVPWAAAAFYSRLKFSESSTLYHHHWTQWLYVVETLVANGQIRHFWLSKNSSVWIRDSRWIWLIQRKWYQSHYCLVSFSQHQPLSPQAW